MNGTLASWLKVSAAAQILCLLSFQIRFYDRSDHLSKVGFFGVFW